MGNILMDHKNIIVFSLIRVPVSATATWLEEDLRSDLHCHRHQPLRSFVPQVVSVGHSNDSFRDAIKLTIISGYY